jgi:hypothetical protein
MEAVLVILGLMGGAIVALLHKLRKLESDKKLNDISVEDSKQEEKQSQVQEEKAVLKKELEKIDQQKASDLSDEEIEKYWGDRKK